jgi:hypothetical protein
MRRHVTPVKTGIRKAQCALDTRLRGYDGFTGMTEFECLERPATAQAYHLRGDGGPEQAQCALDTRLRGYDGFRYDWFTGMTGLECLERRATQACHPREDGDPEKRSALWIPAYAGMTGLPV